MESEIVSGAITLETPAPTVRAASARLDSLIEPLYLYEPPIMPT